MVGIERLSTIGWVKMKLLEIEFTDLLLRLLQEKSEFLALFGS